MSPSHYKNRVAVHASNKFKGTHYYHNKQKTKEIRCKEGEQPKGWLRGKIFGVVSGFTRESATLNKILYYGPNGEKKFFEKGHAPKGWKRSEFDKYKSSLKFVYYYNPKTKQDKRFKIGEKIPKGWKKGRYFYIKKGWKAK